MKLNLLAIVFLLSILLPRSTPSADVPHFINYQGFLTDSSGDPVADDTYQVTFRVYCGNPSTVQWTSGDQNILVVNGVFNYQLGSSSALPIDIFKDASDCVLGITVGTDLELTPRTKLSSVPYAHHSLSSDSTAFANNSDMVDNQHAVSFAPASHSHTPGQISPQGSGSNLDADHLDGQNASAFAVSNHTHANNATLADQDFHFNVFDNSGVFKAGGWIRGDGTIETGNSGNFTCQRNGPGRYVFNFSDFNYSQLSMTASVTPIRTTGLNTDLRTVVTWNEVGMLYVFLYEF